MQTACDRSSRNIRHAALQTAERSVASASNAPARELFHDYRDGTNDGDQWLGWRLITTLPPFALCRPVCQPRAG